MPKFVVVSRDARRKTYTPWYGDKRFPGHKKGEFKTRKGAENRIKKLKKEAKKFIKFSGAKLKVRRQR